MTSDLGRPLCHPMASVPPRLFVHFCCILLCFWPVLCARRSKIRSGFQCMNSSATTVKEQHGQGKEGRSSRSSMTATIIESHGNNTSPIQEGHQSTERAILFIKNNQTVSETHICV